MSDSIIRDRIFLSTQDHRTRKRLLQERSLTLSKYIDQRGIQNVQDAGADIISKQPAQLRLENCTAWGMNPPLTAMWSTLQAFLHNWKRYKPSRKSIITQK